MFNLKNKHIFITGGASGIGLAVAKRLSDAGAVLSICDLNDQETDLGQYFQADVSDPFALEQALSQAAKHTPIDVLINNAGINGEDGVSIEDSNLDLTRRLLDINTLGVYHGLKFGPRFMNDGGSIINTSFWVQPWCFRARDRTQPARLPF